MSESVEESVGTSPTDGYTTLILTLSLTGTLLFLLFILVLYSTAQTTRKTTKGGSKEPFEYEEEDAADAADAAPSKKPHVMEVSAVYRSQSTIEKETKKSLRVTEVFGGPGGKTELV